MAFFRSFKKAAPPSWILEVQIFNGRTAQEGRTASPCQISPIQSNHCRNMAIFSRWRPFAIFGLLCACSDHTRRAFGGSLSLCKIWL